MKRPIGFTIISLFLGWLSIAGFGNAAVILSGSFEGMPIYYGVFALLYGLFAIVTAVGLWEIKNWSLLALRAWMVVCLVFIVLFSIDFFGFETDGIVHLALSLGLFLVIFWWLNSYVSKKFKSIT